MFQDSCFGAREARTNSPLSKLIPLAFLVVLLWLPTGNAAQSSPQTGGADTANLIARIDALFARYNKPDSPGCALGVIKDGKLVYTRGYGMANLEHQIPNGPQIVYDIGSMAKQFTAASVLLLAGQGKLSLDDDVRKYIPELPAYEKPITLRHMLHHTSGLRDYAALFTLAAPSEDEALRMIVREDEALKMIVRQKGLDMTPGDDFIYSNTGYFLLSFVVKRVSGKSLAEFAKEQIFDPLGMKSTLILDQRKRIVPRRATGYAEADGGFQIEMSNWATTGDGAVQTSIEDLWRWDQNFYEPMVGGRAFVEQMQTVGALNNGQRMDYAFGLFVREYKGLPRVWHDGVDAGYVATLVRFPEQKFSVACLCNVDNANPSGWALRIADLYLADQFKAGTPTNPASITLTESELKPKVGLYRSPASGQLERVTLRDGKLRIDFFGRSSFELMPLSAERFRAPQMGNQDVAFEPRPDGKLQLRLTRRIGYDRRSELFEPIAAAAPQAAELAEYVGSYYSEELDVVYHFQVESGGLKFFRQNGPKQSLQPTFHDGFANSELMRLEFKRNAQGKPTGFTLGMARMRGDIKFVRPSK